MKVTSLRYLDVKFHHPSLGASPPNRGNRISCVQNSRKTDNRNSVNNSGIGILCSKNSNGRLAFPAVAGLLVVSLSVPRAPPLQANWIQQGSSFQFQVSSFRSQVPCFQFPVLMSYVSDFWTYTLWFKKTRQFRRTITTTQFSLF